MAIAKKITLLLAEDHAIVRQGLSALLRLDGDFEMVGEARTGREAVEMALRLKPDVILMDIAMPVLNGIEATRQILAADPTAKVLILSAYSDDGYIQRMNAAGVAGFLEKQTSVELLTKAIRVVAGGGKYFSPGIAKRLQHHASAPRDRAGVVKPQGHALTPREREVLQLVTEGFANKQIAAELGIAVKTVEKHRWHLMDKLDIHDTATLTRYAVSAGIVESSVQVTII